MTSAAPLQTRLWLAGTALGLFSLLSAPQAHAQMSWPSLTAPPASQGGGDKDAALIVGIEDYFIAPDIPGAADNARDWYIYLTQGRGVPVERTVLLRNQEGTREKILRSLKESADRVEPGGTLWFIFIGHGAPGPKGKDGVLVGVDAQQEAESLYTRSILQGELLAALPQNARRSVVLLDACFSGRAGDGQPLVAGLQPLLPVEHAARRPGLVLLSAGSPDQFAGPLPGLARPAFSYLLLGGLRGWADRDEDRTVSAQEAIDYARSALTVLLRDRVQTPHLLAEERGDALSTNALEKGPDISGLVTAPPPSQAHRGPSPITGSPRTGLGTIRLEAKDSGGYQLSVVNSNGEVVSCGAQALKDAPCSVGGLPQGKTLIRIEGDANREQEIDLGKETVVIGVDGAAGWYGTTSLITLGGGFIVSIIGISSFADEDGSRSTASLILLTAGVPILYTASMVFGVLWLIDKDEVTTEHFPQPESSLRGLDDGLDINVQLGATQDGAVLGLDMRW